MEKFGLFLEMFSFEVRLIYSQYYNRLRLLGILQYNTDVDVDLLIAYIAFSLNMKFEKKKLSFTYHRNPHIHVIR